MLAVLLFALLVLGLSARVASAQSAQDFADWTSVSSTVASGTLHGSSISLSAGTSNTSGTSTVFSGCDFTPPLPTNRTIRTRTLKH